MLAFARVARLKNVENRVEKSGKTKSKRDELFYLTFFLGEQLLKATTLWTSVIVVRRSSVVAAQCPPSFSCRCRSRRANCQRCVSTRLVEVLLLGEETRFPHKTFIFLDEAMASLTLHLLTIVLGVVFIFLGQVKLSPQFFPEYHTFARNEFGKFNKEFPFYQQTGWRPLAKNYRTAVGVLEMSAGTLFLLAGGSSSLRFSTWKKFRFFSFFSIFRERRAAFAHGEFPLDISKSELSR